MQTNLLPEICFGTLQTTGETIIIKLGEKGYYRTEDQRPADELNEEIGVTKAQRKAMEMGSLFAWDIPAANPLNYDEDGKLKRKL